MLYVFVQKGEKIGFADFCFFISWNTVPEGSHQRLRSFNGARKNTASGVTTAHDDLTKNKHAKLPGHTQKILPSLEVYAVYASLFCSLER